MKHLTVRGLPDDLARALQEEKERSGESLNQLVIDLLCRALGLPDGEYDNGLNNLAGGWSEEELRDFERHTELFEQVDDELWG